MVNMNIEQKYLPSSLLAKGNLEGNEYAWPISDIPEVIETARKLSLVSIGGQLQFRFPNGVCECYWVEVDTYKETDLDILNWQERVERSAAAATVGFERLLARYDFIAEGRKNFSKAFEEYEAKGGDIADVMCFVWYLDAQDINQINE